MSRIMSSASSKWEHTQKMSMNRETGRHQTLPPKKMYEYFYLQLQKYNKQTTDLQKPLNLWHAIIEE